MEDVGEVRELGGDVDSALDQLYQNREEAGGTDCQRKTVAS